MAVADTLCPCRPVTRVQGNGGAGGADRRGVDDGNRRPASVKASLSVAMGQRAPNRSGAREEGRGKDPSMGRGHGGHGAAAAAGERERERGAGGAGRERGELVRTLSRSPPAAGRAAGSREERDGRDLGRERDSRDRCGKGGGGAGAAGGEWLPSLWGMYSEGGKACQGGCMELCRCVKVAGCYWGGQWMES